MHKFSSNLKISNFKFFLGNPPKIPVSSEFAWPIIPTLIIWSQFLKCMYSPSPQTKPAYRPQGRNFQEKYGGGEGPKVELNPKGPITLCNFLSNLSHNALARQVAAQCNMGCLTIFLLREALHKVELSFTFCNGLNSN